MKRLVVAQTDIAVLCRAGALGLPISAIVLDLLVYLVTMDLLMMLMNVEDVCEKGGKEGGRNWKRKLGATPVGERSNLDRSLLVSWS